MRSAIENSVLPVEIEVVAQISHPAGGCDQVLLSAAGCAGGLEALYHGLREERRRTHL